MNAVHDGENSSGYGRRWSGWAMGLVLVAATSGFGADLAVAGEKLSMWRIQGEKAAVTMVGSIHVGTPDMYPLPEPMEEAFAAASVLAVELDISNPETVQAMAMIVMKEGMLPGDETVQTRLEPEVYARLEDFCTERNVPLAMYMKIKPGMLALILVAEEYERRGFKADLGMDKHFLDAARETGKEIRELESVESQLNLFLTVSDQLDDALFDSFLDQMEEIGDMTATMIELLTNGKSAELAEFIETTMGDDPEVVAFMDDLLLDRNLAMAATIDQWLHQDEDVFVVVGGGHYGGEDGLVKMLTDKGWQVEQVSR